MTYSLFLMLFLVPPIGLLALSTFSDARRGRRLPPGLCSFPAGLAVGLHLLLAVLYTTPWDNYLVATGVWTYNPALVTGITLGWVPVEEYAFFVLQTLLSALWLLFLARRLAPDTQSVENGLHLRRSASLAFGAAWLASLALLLSGWRPATYLALILVWALPPLLLQLAFGPDILWKHRRLVIASLASASLYLGLCDSLAIGAGTWSITPGQSLQIFLPGGLPVEELLFFVVTNLLVINGITLLLAAESRKRLGVWVSHLRFSEPHYESKELPEA